MTKVFLIGGTGNQIFQYARSKKEDTFSLLFTHRRIRKLFNHTDHPQVLRFPRSNAIGTFFLLPLLVSDFVFVRFLGISLFTEFDLLNQTCAPRIKKLMSIGYFQEEIGERDIRDTLDVEMQKVRSDTVAMHIRGGDFLSAKNAAGQLSPTYYENALKQALKVSTPKSVTVYTNDRAYAEAVCSNLPRDLHYDFCDGALLEMVRDCVTAQTYISSNSTLSYWICRLRDTQQTTISPVPFTLARQLPTLEYSIHVEASFHKSEDTVAEQESAKKA